MCVDGGGGARSGVFIYVFVGVGRWGIVIMVGGDCVAGDVGDCGAGDGGCCVSVVIRCCSSGGSVRALVSGKSSKVGIGSVGRVAVVVSAGGKSILCCSCNDGGSVVRASVGRNRVTIGSNERGWYLGGVAVVVFIVFIVVVAAAGAFAVAVVGKRGAGGNSRAGFAGEHGAPRTAVPFRVSGIFETVIVVVAYVVIIGVGGGCLLYTSPSPRD